MQVLILFVLHQCKTIGNVIKKGSKSKGIWTKVTRILGFGENIQDQVYKHESEPRTETELVTHTPLFSLLNDAVPTARVRSSNWQASFS